MKVFNKINNKEFNMNKSFKKILTLLSLNILFSSNQPIINAMHEHDTIINDASGMSIFGHQPDFIEPVANPNENSNSEYKYNFNENGTSYLVNPNITDEDTTKLMYFFADINRFSLPLGLDNKTYVVRDRLDGHVYLVLTFAPEHKRIYFKHIDSSYNFDHEHLKNCIKTLYDNSEPNKSVFLCNAIDCFEAIELDKSGCFDHIANICFHSEKGLKIKKGIKNLNLSEKLKNVTKKLRKVYKTSELKIKLLGSSD